MPRLVVVGGGIGGLACALVAAERGYDVVVLERASVFTEIGAGIQLAPNAFRALEQLGVVDQVRERAVFVDGLRLMDALTGDRVVELELGAGFVERYGQPYAVVHRHDLYQPLLHACQAHARVELRPGHEVLGYERTGAGASVRLAGGGSVDGDAVIGADGLRSRVRAQLVGDGAPRVSGHTIFRSVIPMEDVPEHLRSDAATLWAGPGFHMVHYPIADARSMNLACTVDDGAKAEVVGVPVADGRVSAVVENAHPRVRALVALGRDWHSWVLCDRDPVEVWTDGPVLLIGDAAHPMLQYAAQGAAMALEDAICLSEVLDGPAVADLAGSFARFQEIRSTRTARVQRISRMMGTDIYHNAGPAAKERNAQLGTLAQPDLHAKLDWLYLHGHETAEAR